MKDSIRLEDVLGGVGEALISRLQMAQDSGLTLASLLVGESTVRNVNKHHTSKYTARRL